MEEEELQRLNAESEKAVRGLQEQLRQVRMKIESRTLERIKLKHKQQKIETQFGPGIAQLHKKNENLQKLEKEVFVFLLCP
jgi:hypothetical protein